MASGTVIQPPPGFVLDGSDARPEITIRPPSQLSAPAVPPPPGFVVEGSGLEESVNLPQREPSIPDPSIGDALAHTVSQGITLGTSDEIAAGLRSGAGLWGDYGEALADERANLERARERHPWASTMGEIAGGATLGLGAAGSGATLMRAGQSLPKAMMAGAGEGAAYAGAYGFGTGEGDAGKRLESAADAAKTGAVVGAAVPVASRALGSIINAVRGRGAENAILRGAPTEDQLREAAEAAYAKAEQAGVIIDPEGVRRITRDIIGDLTEIGATPALQPRAFEALKELQKAEARPITLKGIDILRRIVSNGPGASQDRTEKMIAGKMVNRIDDYLASIKPGDVIAGDAKVGAQALSDARAFWRQMRKGEILSEAEELAKRRAQSTYGGGNLNNATRQEVRKILDSKKLSRGFSASEKAALEKVVRGTPVQNAMRVAGKYSASGPISTVASGMVGSSLGGILGGPLGATIGAGALPALGSVVKSAADKGTLRQLALAEAIIRSGKSPQAAQAAAKEQIDAILRGILMGGGQSGGNIVSRP